LFARSSRGLFLWISSRHSRSRESASLRMHEFSSAQHGRTEQSYHFLCSRQHFQLFRMSRMMISMRMTEDFHWRMHRFHRTLQIRRWWVKAPVAVLFLHCFQWIFSLTWPFWVEKVGLCFGNPHLSEHDKAFPLWQGFPLTLSFSIVTPSDRKPTLWNRVRCALKSRAPLKSKLRLVCESLTAASAGKSSFLVQRGDRSAVRFRWWLVFRSRRHEITCCL
jgi:hypothetical protein